MSSGVSMSSKLSSIFAIASNEFKRVALEPLSIVVFIFLLLLVFLEGLGNSVSPEISGGLIAHFIYGLYVIGQYFAAVAVFIGATSLAEERSRNSLFILLTKPLYRRDIVIGKYLGLSTFLVLFILSVYLAYTMVLFVLVGMPASMADFILRFISLALIMFLVSSLAMSMAMLAGVLFKNVLQAALVAVTFFFIVWYSPLLNNLGALSSLSPFMLSFQIIMGNSSSYMLLDPTISYMTWLSAALPFLVFNVLEIIAILSVDCMMFVRREEA